MLDASYKALLKVSIPIMLGMLIQFAIFIVDAAFLGRLPSSIPFDAVGTAGLIVLTLTSVCYGLYFGAQILIAKYLGKNNAQISKVFYSSFILLFIAGLICFILTLLISNIGLQYIIDDFVLENAMQSFLNLRAFGFLFSIAGFTFLALYTGIAQTKFLVWSSIVVASVNIILDYALIFGNFGLPELGMLGAAWASNIAEFSGLVFGILYLIFHKKSNQIVTSIKFGIDFEIIKRVLKISSPLMIQGLLATFGWAVFFLLIEKIGLKELEVSQVIRNIYYIALVPIIGYGTTTKTYVSNFLSYNADNKVISTLLFKLGILSFVSISIISIVNFIFPEYVLALITNKEHIVKASVPVLKLISGALLLFSIASILTNAIAGAGKTLAVMYIEGITILIYLTLSYYVSIVNYTSFYLVWCMEYVYFILLGSIAAFYIYRTQLFKHHE